MPDRHASSAAAAPVATPARMSSTCAGPLRSGGFACCCRCRCRRRSTICIPAGMAPPEPGSFVRVPLGGRSLVGVVWDGAGGELAADRLKPIAEILPTRALTPDLRRFVERVAAYTMAPPGAVLRMAMSVAGGVAAAAAAAALRHHRGRARRAGRRPPATSLTPARRRVLEVLRDAPPLPAAEAGAARRLRRRRRPRSDRARAGRGAPGRGRAGRLRRAGWRRPVRRCPPTRRSRRGRLVERVEAGGFGVTLLDGVTGSGKTETYFAAIAAALAAGRQVLVLLPEIALGAQWLAAVSRALRRAAGRNGIPISAQTAAPRHLARRRRRPGAGRRRRALGTVPAVCRARPDRRRRGARPLLQAGGRRLLSGARHGGAARLLGADPDRAGLGDAVARNRRQRRARPLPAGRPAAPPRGGRAARGARSSIMRRRSGSSAAASCRRRWSPHSPRPWRPASRRCCS